MKNLEGKDWANDIESLVIGPNTSVYAYEDKDFKDTEIVHTSGVIVYLLMSMSELF